jgi:uncharacterized OsmC-like protein
MADSDVRSYQARAASTDIFGRVLCSVRDHKYLIDGPAQNGCPGEEVTPGELFLSAVAACGVELIQVIARTDGVPLHGVQVEISGQMDRSRPVRADVSLFNSVSLRFQMQGVTNDDAKRLVEKFKGR